MICNPTRAFALLYLYNLFVPSLASSVGGVTVSMVAFQAVDPGSTPGRRTSFFIFYFLARISPPNTQKVKRRRRNVIFYAQTPTLQTQTPGLLHFLMRCKKPWGLRLKRWSLNYENVNTTMFHSSSSLLSFSGLSAPLRRLNNAWKNAAYYYYYYCCCC